MRIAVAMSGGVDSSVAAALLTAQGHEVVGLFMKLHDAPPGSASCCGLDEAADARAVAHQLGIPFFALDLRDPFRRAVVDDLIGDYAAGRTPNPCVRCNGQIKFRVLRDQARQLGCDALATGHYARRVDTADGPALAVAADASRDQTYFLWSTPADALGDLLLPLGDLTKAAVRERARTLGLPNADKPDSQEICFIPDGDVSAFLRRERPELGNPGTYVGDDGRVLGQHGGAAGHTVGQRRGLGLSLGSPTYVRAIDTERGVVHVTTDPRRLLHGAFGLRDVVRHANFPEDGLSVRVRHRGQRVPARVQGDRVTLLSPLRGVTPGQSAVFYDGDRLLGGGVVTQASPWTEA